MKNIKKEVLDFVTGEMKPAEFVKLCKEDPSIIEWIQSIVPEGKICYKNTKEIEPDGYIKYADTEKLKEVVQFH